MSAIDIVIDPHRCRSMGVCVQMAQDIFDLDEKSGLAVIISATPDLALAREAAEQCPTRAIKLIPRE